MEKRCFPKKRVCKFVSFLFCCIFLLPTLVFGQSYKIPQPTFEFYANDFADLLSSTTIDQINYLGKDTYEYTGETQVVFVSLPEIPASFEEYSNELFNKWKIGKNDKGILFLVAQGEQEMAARIEVGYGHEGELTDLESDFLLQNFFKVRSEEGIEKAVFNTYTDIIRKITDENYAIIQKESGLESFIARHPLAVLLIAILIVILFILDFIFFGGYFTYLILRILGSGGGRGGGSSGGGGRSGGGGASRRG